VPRARESNLREIVLIDVQTGKVEYSGKQKPGTKRSAAVVQLCVADPLIGY
jgi:hypothetical protein